MSDNKQTFMKNVAIILFAQIAVKVLGFVYRMVIVNVPGFGNEGNGYYTAGFQVYTLLLAISSVGIPNAISKLTSEKLALEDYRGAHRIFKTALLLFGIIGVVFAAGFYLSSDFIAERVIEMAGAKYVLKALSPSIFFVCVSSVITGYFLGQSNMKASGSSQVIEQIFKCTFTIIIVLMMVGQLPEFMAAGANFATSLATAGSFIYLVIFYLRRRKGIKEKVEAQEKEFDRKPRNKIMLVILMTSVPISLGAIINAINRVIDTATITRGIAKAFANGIPGIAGIPTAEQLTDKAVYLAGMLGKADTLTNLPLALNIAFATVLVPTIAHALTVGNKKEASEKISYSFMISVLIIYPCVAGLISLAEPIYGVIYPAASDGAYLLKLSALAILFSALNQTVSGSLQGMGKIYTPACGLVVGAIVKVILNVTLIPMRSINIAGAAISSIVCNLIAFSICFIVLNKNIKLNLSLKKYVLKPGTASVAMGLSAIAVHKLGVLVTGSNFISTILAIIVAVSVYVVLVFVLKLLTKEEAEMLPMGNKIARFMK